MRRRARRPNHFSISTATKTMLASAMQIASSVAVSGWVLKNVFNSGW